VNSGFKLGGGDGRTSDVAAMAANPLTNLLWGFMPFGAGI
jgi:hypothetical protein